MIPDESLDDEIVASYQLALTEACSNIVRHAYPDGNGNLQLEAAYDPEKLVFRVRDTGQPFDPSEVPPPSFDGSRSGGFGVFIIRQIFDTVSYSRDEAGVNCLELVAHLPTKRGNQ